MTSAVTRTAPARSRSRGVASRVLVAGLLALGACGDPAPPPATAIDVGGAPIDGTAEPAPSLPPELAIGDTSAPATPAGLAQAPPGTAVPEPAAATAPVAAIAADPVKPSDADLAAAPADPAEPARKSFLTPGRKKDEPLVLDWEQLASFDYVPPAPAYPDPETGVLPDSAAEVEKARRQIPPDIWELEGVTISVDGFMIPLEYVDDGVKSFLVSRHAMGCCFGVVPRPHEMVECHMPEGKTTEYVGYVPIVVTGRLHVEVRGGPQTMLTPIYSMESPKVTRPKD